MTNSFIEQYYSSLKNDLTFSQRAEIYYQIIFLKKEENIQDYYVDIKEFLKNYVQSIDEKKYGYDTFNLAKVRACIALLDKSQKISIYRFLKKILNKFQFDETWEELKDDLYEVKVQALKTRKFWFFSPLSFAKYLYFKSVYSFPFLLLLLFFVIVIQIVILLPNPGHLWPSLFKVKYEEINPNSFLNHVYNVILGFFEIDTDFKIIPENFIGLVFLIFGRMLKIIFVLKYASDILLKKISLDE